VRSAIWTTVFGLILVWASAAHGGQAEEKAEPAPEAPDPEPLDPEATNQQLDEDQAQRERDVPRPPLADVPPPQPPLWHRRLEIGADAALISRPFATTKAENIRYDTAIGWGIHVNWKLVSWLRFHTYFVDAHHDLRIPPGAFASDAANSVSSSSAVSDATVRTFAFGAKLAPTWQFTSRARAWISAGIGWGRLNFPNMTVTEPAGESYDIRERDASFVEFPIGVGIAYDVWPRWITIQYAASGAPVIGQSGSAHEPFQAVDADGQLRDVAALGAFDASFVQTLGLSLIL